ncbi:MAG: DUF2232 domain-containing protein [Gemmatimonadota bacterium]
MLLIASLALAAAALLAGRRFGVWLALVPALLPLGALVSGAYPVAPAVALAPLVGWIAALQLDRGRPYGEVIAAAAVPGALQGLLLLAAVHGDAPAREQLVEEMLRQVEAMHLAAPEAGYALRDVVSAVVRLQPGIELLSVLLLAVLAYRLGAWAAPRLRLPVPDPVPVRDWRLWDQLIWVLIAGMAAALIAAEGLAGDLALNVIAVMGVLYAVQGFSVSRFYLWRMGAPRPLEFLYYAVLLLTSGAAALVLAGVGLMDTWFDWRRLGHGAERTPPGGQ